MPYDSIAKQLDLNDTTTGRVTSLTHSLTHSLTLLPLAVHRPGSMVPTSSVRLTVTEGKYRMVRRILHNAGHSVIALHRRRYGNHPLTHLLTHSLTHSLTYSLTHSLIRIQVIYY